VSVSGQTRWSTQCSKLTIRVLDEAEPRTALADGVRRALRLDALPRQRREGRVEVVDADGDVAVAGTEVVRPAVVVEGQLELLVLAGHAEEVVRRLLLAVAHDVHVAAKLEPERLVEGPALLRIGDPVHRVEVARHAGIVVRQGLRAQARARPLNSRPTVALLA
jgi:hypothetical protein